MVDLIRPMRLIGCGTQVKINLNTPTGSQLIQTTAATNDIVLWLMSIMGTNGETIYVKKLVITYVKRHLGNLDLWLENNYCLLNTL